MSKSKEFIDAIHALIQYWDHIERDTCKEKMEGLAHSILCMLDGISGSFDGSIEDLIKYNGGLHELLWYKDRK